MSLFLPSTALYIQKIRNETLNFNQLLKRRSFMSNNKLEVRTGVILLANRTLDIVLDFEKRLKTGQKLKQPCRSPLWAYTMYERSFAAEKGGLYMVWAYMQYVHCMGLSAVIYSIPLYVPVAALGKFFVFSGFAGAVLPLILQWSQQQLLGRMCHQMMERKVFDTESK